ncbi:MAG: tryptophan--tRNA ligase [archaeon]
MTFKDAKIPVSISVKPELLEKYPSLKFAAMFVGGIDNSTKLRVPEKYQKALAASLKKRVEAKESFPQADAHGKEFFSKFGKSVPIEFQIESVAKGKNPPREKTFLEDLLFYLEMKGACMISCHDISTHKDNTLTFNLSEKGATYETLSGAKKTLVEDDIVLSDGENVLISLLNGPGSYDKITPKTKEVVFIFWFFGTEDTEKFVKAALEDMTALFAEAEQKPRISEFLVATPTPENFKEIAKKESFTVTPWEVRGDVDYSKLIKQFGTNPLDEKILARLKRHTGGELHHFLRRKIFFSHRDLDLLLDHYEKGGKFALYTGRGPSGKTHLGHLIPWFFCKWLQDKFGCDLYFEITDDEKHLVKDLSLEETKKLAYENILDIIAIGFDPKKTKIFLDTEYARTLYPLAVRVSKKVTFSSAKATFGFTNESNIGIVFFPAMQAAPCFLPSFLEGKEVPVLIPAAIDQDPYWRVARDVAPKLGYPKPAAIHCRFLPGLEQGGKMSSSEGAAIYTTDSPKEIRAKIMKYAFSGGQPTVEEHRKLGGNPDIDVPYQYLTFFEESDSRLKQIHDNYRSGKLLTGEMKQLLVDKLSEFLAKHQAAREAARKRIGEFILKD